MKLTRKQRDVVEWLAWGMKHVGSLVTNRKCPRRVMRRLVELGIAESVGMAVECDDDGFHVEPERWREGFRLTALGTATHATIMDEYRRQLHGAQDEFNGLCDLIGAKMPKE